MMAKGAARIGAGRTIRLLISSSLPVKIDRGSQVILRKPICYNG
jgi:hypothetical protein